MIVRKISGILFKFFANVIMIFDILYWFTYDVVVLVCFHDQGSIHACILMITALLNCAYIYFFISTQIGWCIQFFFLNYYFMSVNHTYMHFNGCSFTKFRTFCRFLHNNVTSSSEFFFFWFSQAWSLYTYVFYHACLMNCFNICDDA